jgi:hypothetical protein
VSRVYKDWYPGKVKIEPEGRSADVFKQKAKSAANVEHYLRVARRGRLPTAVCRPVVLEVDTRRGAEVEICKREQEQFSEEIKSPGTGSFRRGPRWLISWSFSSQECGNGGLDVKENRLIA